eukprot:scaffold97298_cov63-Attheya_sp.AAC.2
MKKVETPTRARDVTVELFFKMHSLHRQHSFVHVHFHSLEAHLHSNPLILPVLSLASVSTGEDSSGKFEIPGTNGTYFTPNGNEEESMDFL